MEDRQIPLFGEKVEPMEKGASFSDCRTHRFALWRIWDRSKPLVMFIGLNPSQANESKDDPTIESVERLSRFNGYGGFYMTNCWSFISTDPDLLKCEPFFLDFNDNVLRDVSQECDAVVFAWGNFKVVRDKKRDAELIKMFPGALCISKNKNGSPGHPLFKKGTIKFIEYGR